MGQFTDAISDDFYAQNHGKIQGSAPDSKITYPVTGVDVHHAMLLVLLVSFWNTLCLFEVSRGYKQVMPVYILCDS